MSYDIDEKYTSLFDDGVYHCRQCGNPLFRSEDKFKSTTIWPSFRTDMPNGTATRPDHSQGMERTEIICKSCGAHLGHVFDDGSLSGDVSDEAGARFCVLSDALAFEPKDTKQKKKTS